MKSHVKALVTLALVGGSLCAALLTTPAKAWADPPGRWGYYGNSYRNAPYPNNGIFGGFFGNRNHHPNQYEWNRARQIAWRREGHAFGHYQPFPPGQHRRFW